jgi:hypothetical protein
MGCQREIAKTIIEQGADYVLALKGNQGNLHDDVRQLFTSARVQKFHNIEQQFHSTVEKGHWRIENRCYWTMGNTEFLIGYNITFLARWIQIAARRLRNSISKSLVFSSVSTPGELGYFKRGSET